jgi:predicted nuclease of predicted toxin-antitoxin system
VRLLLDQGLPRSAAALLRERGYDIVHVGELGMSAARDEAIIEYARASGKSIVTLDADFHSFLAVSQASGPSVIRIRVQRLKAPECASLIETVIERVGHELSTGCFVTVTRNSIRIRRLTIWPRG